jgi:hypothetical protein
MVSGLAFLIGCESVPKEALMLQPTTLQDRKMESRRFSTNDEEKVLKACAAYLQDVGFNISESAPKLGLIVAYKDRSAIEGGQVAAKVFLALLGGNMAIDMNQRFKASVVTRLSVENTNEVVVRVTFQRIVYNEQSQITRMEELKDPKQYEEFFAGISKSLFLTANDI